MTFLQRAEEIGSAVVGAFSALFGVGARACYSPAQRVRIATRLFLYSLRIAAGATMTMQRENFLRATAPGGPPPGVIITGWKSGYIDEHELRAGWHWCPEFDYDLLDPWSCAVVCCNCDLSWRGRLKRAIVRAVYFVKWDVLGGRQRALKELEREFK